MREENAAILAGQLCAGTKLIQRGLTAVVNTCICIFVVSLSACDQDGIPPPPNVVIIVADDLGWNDVGAFGHPYTRTPNIDKLARRGMRFNQAFLTTSSCSPSRASILTARYPHNTGAMHLHQPLPAEQITFVDQLRNAGYYTAAFPNPRDEALPCCRLRRLIRGVGPTSSPTS